MAPRYYNPKEEKKKNNAIYSLQEDKPVAEKAVKVEKVAEPSIYSYYNRKTGYDGPISEEQYNSTKPVTVPEIPSYEQNVPGAYSSPYSAQIDSILNGILNKNDFSYNAATDPMYQINKNLYTQQANQGMRDTMGNAAALSGGYGNSYAANTGQQAYNSQMSQLNNMIPELYQLAFQKYQDDRSNDYNSLSALQGLENAAYGKYRNQVGDFQTDRNYYYNKDQNSLQQQNWMTQFDYGKTQDQLAQENYLNEFLYGKQRDAVADDQWNKTYERGVLENDRNYNRGVYEYDNSMDYQKDRDAVTDNQWNTTFNYNASQDEQNRADDMYRFNTNLALDSANSVTEASQKNVTQYTGLVNDMLSQTQKRADGGTAYRYTPAQVYEYLLDSDLTDEEIAQVIESSYELNNYINSKPQEEPAYSKPDSKKDNAKKNNKKYQESK